MSEPEAQAWRASIANGIASLRDQKRMLSQVIQQKVLEQLFLKKWYPDFPCDSDVTAMVVAKRLVAGGKHLTIVEFVGRSLTVLRERPVAPLELPGYAYQAMCPDPVDNPIIINLDNVASVGKG
ncbi:unnamed protein product, partial [Prorocentrum cordatum]